MTIKEFIRINRPVNFNCINHILVVNSDTPYLIDLAVVNDDIEEDVLYLFTDDDGEKITSMKQLCSSLIEVESYVLDLIVKRIEDEEERRKMIQDTLDAVDSFIENHLGKKVKRRNQ